jgi:hypothetical protein
VEQLVILQMQILFRDRQGPLSPLRPLLLVTTPRDYADELNLCRRYYQKTFPYGVAPAQSGGLTGALVNVAATSGAGSISFRVYMSPAMLAVPTLVTFNPVLNDANWWDANANASRLVATFEITNESFRIVMNAATTAGAQHFIHYTVESEL